MKFVTKTAMMVALGLAVSACSSPETATRNLPMADTMATTGMFAAAPSYQPTAISIRVPQELKVSEANLYFPSGDIVWRGDARGNRHEQVKAIFETAANLGLSTVTGARPVTVDVELKRFHSLTEKTRYTVGGVHSIKFVITLRDAETGQIVRAPREVIADLQGYGGNMALEAEAKGLTQKYRITRHLAKVLRDELSLPTGFVPPKGGITARVSQI